MLQMRQLSRVYRTDTVTPPPPREREQRQRGYQRHLEEQQHGYVDREPHDSRNFRSNGNHNNGPNTNMNMSMSALTKLPTAPPKAFPTQLSHPSSWVGTGPYHAQ